MEKMLALLSNKSVIIWKYDYIGPSELLITVIVLLSDPGNRLLMDLEGRKPANPFPDERSFEDSLQLNFHPGMNHEID